ncbi:MAG: type II toxin-antitoxin system death-on-curing family toxin [Actinobacteria bacterium]|nr:type II toxin-antitoxin system death-on-curing family toxin [Actinomycetota bacterium]
MICERLGLVVRDPGLLASAAARPGTTVFGEDAYPDLAAKAASVMHSIVAHHPLVDGNKRLGWLALVLTLDLNGVRLDVPDDEAVDVTTRVAAGSSGIDDLAARVRSRLPTPPS